MPSTRFIYDDPVAMSYLQTLHQCMAQRRLKYADIARIIEITPGHIGRISRGERDCTIRVYNKLAKLFGWPSYSPQSATLTLGLDEASREPAEEKDRAPEVSSPKRIGRPPRYADKSGLKKISIYVPCLLFENMQDFAYLKGMSQSELAVEAVKEMLAPFQETLAQYREIRKGIRL